MYLSRTSKLKALMLVVFVAVMSYKVLSQEVNKEALKVQTSKLKSYISQSQLPNTKSINENVPKNKLVLVGEYKTYSDFLDPDGKISVLAKMSETPIVKQDKKLGKCEIYEAKVTFYDIKNRNKVIKEIRNQEYGEIDCEKVAHPSFAVPEAMEYSPDGKTLALKISSGAINDYVHLYDVASLKKIQELTYSDFEDCCTIVRKEKTKDAVFYTYNTPIDFATFSSDGKLFAAASEVEADEGSLRVWDIQTGKMIFYVPFAEEYKKYKDEKFELPFMFSSNKRYLHWFGGISWDISTGEELSSEQTKTIFKYEMGCQTFSSDKKIGLRQKVTTTEVIDTITEEVKFYFDRKDFFQEGEKIIKINQQGNVLITTIPESKIPGLPIKIRHWQIK